MTTDSRRSLFNELEAAAQLGMSVRTLQGWRTAGRGPMLIRLGGAVRYSADDIEAFVRDGRRARTSAPTAKDFR